MSDCAYCLAKSIAALPHVEAVDRLGVRLGDLREVRHEVRGLREGRPGGLAAGVGELALHPLELVGEAAQFVVAALVVRSDRVDRAVHLLLDVRGDRPARLVGHEARRPDVLEVLDGRPGVGPQEGDLGLLDQGQDGVDRAAADEAGQHVDLVLLDQLGRRGHGGRRAVALVGDDQLDLTAAQLVVVRLQVQLETGPQLGADRLVGAGERGDEADLQLAVAGVAATGASGDRGQAEGDGGGAERPGSAAGGRGAKEHGGTQSGERGRGYERVDRSGGGTGVARRRVPTERPGQLESWVCGSRSCGERESPTWLISSAIM